MADSRYKDITVRMLLNHSSGIMGTGLAGAILFDDADPSATDGLLEALSTQRLIADPGAYSVYCNDGFTLAELVVEAVSGMDFMDYVDREILDPLGLENTFAPGDDFDTARLAKTYSGSGTEALPQDTLTAVGAGGLYATASDLAAFGGALTGTALLKTASLEAMAYPEYSRGIWPDDTLDALAFGLGWDTVAWYPFCQSGITALAKGGDTLRYHAALVVLPEYDMAAAVVSSGGTSTYDQLAASQILIAALSAQGITVDQTVPTLPEAQPASLPAELKQYAGYYGSTSAQYQIDLADDGTCLRSCWLWGPGPDLHLLRRRHLPGHHGPCGTVLCKGGQRRDLPVPEGRVPPAGTGRPAHLQLRGGEAAGKHRFPGAPDRLGHPPVHVHSAYGRALQLPGLSVSGGDRLRAVGTHSRLRGPRPD